MIFQDPAESLNSRHTVRNIIEEPFIIHKIGTRAERQRRVDELLEKVGLSPAAAVALPIRVLRRPAPAHRHRAGDRTQPEAGRLRRAGLRPRRLGAEPGAQPDDRPAARHGAVLPLHRPRPRGGETRQRPRRRDVSRQDRRAGRRRRDLPATRATPTPKRCSNAIPVPDPSEERASTRSSRAMSHPRSTRPRAAPSATASGAEVPGEHRTGDRHRGDRTRPLGQHLPVLRREIAAWHEGNFTTANLANQIS